MRVIMIAAGRGSRLGSYTDTRPKCMVDVGGGSILDHQLEALRAHGLTDLHIVRGYLADKLVVPGATYHANEAWQNNNILHSLFKAESALEGPLMTTYSDIVYDADVVAAARATSHDIALVIDRDWASVYEGRDDHPVEQAELAEVDGDRVLRVGKAVGPERAAGEFIGLASWTAQGTAQMREVWADVRARLGDDDPFQDAALFRKAYLTDLLNEMIARGIHVGAAFIDGGWREIDTIQDLERFTASTKKPPQV